MRSTAAGVLRRVTIVLSAAVFTGCTQFSVIEEDSSAGFNGSYEIVRSGLPVNWYLYYPPIKNGDVEVSIDTTQAVEGSRSLKFVALRTNPAGRWQTPGLFQVFRAAKENTTYRVSFWLKNQGATASIFVRSEKPKVSPPPQQWVLGVDDTGEDTWRQFEYLYTVPETYDNIRFELNILQPGTLWIDDVRIVERQGSGARFSVRRRASARRSPRTEVRSGTLKRAPLLTQSVTAPCAADPTNCTYF